jgi:phosphatidylinositol glycan class A protein
MIDRLLSLGAVFGPILCIIMAVQHYFFWVLEWYDPREGIEVVEDVWTQAGFEKVGLGGPSVRSVADVPGGGP